MKSEYKEIATIGALIVGAVAVYKISTSAGKAIESFGSGLGGGVNSLLSGAGQSVSYAGQGVYELGSGVGSGVEYLGAGIGGGLWNIGSGIQSIGQGTGYAISGANIQDIVQTILTLGKGEASTYNQGVKLSQETAANQGQDSGASNFAKTQSSVEETTAPKTPGATDTTSLMWGALGKPAIVTLAEAGIKAISGGSSSSSSAKVEVFKTAKGTTTQTTSGNVQTIETKSSSPIVNFFNKFFGVSTKTTQTKY